MKAKSRVTAKDWKKLEIVENELKELKKINKKISKKYNLTKKRVKW